MFLKQSFNHDARDTRTEEPLSIRDNPNGIRQFILPDILYDIAARARFKNLRNVLFVLEAAQNKNLRVRKLQFNDPCGFDARHFRHLKVKNHNVGLEFFDCRDCFFAVGRLADHVKPIHC